MKTRPFSVGSYVHVMKRGTRKMPIVHDTSDMDRFIHMLYYFNDEYCDENWHRSLLDANLLSTWQRLPYWPERKPLVKIIFFCLMPNHFHLLLQEIQEGGIGKFMLRLGNGMTKSYNQKYKTTGSLFEGKYKDRVVEEDDYLRYLSAYIMLKNPFELYDGGMGKAFNEYDKAYEFAKNYKYCSLGDCFDERRFPIIEQNFIEDLFENEDEFKRVAKDLLSGKYFIENEEFKFLE